MLKEVFDALDQWLATENLRRNEVGAPRLERCEIRVVGQTALIEAQVGLTLAETADVDAFGIQESAVREQFDRLLRARGRFLDPDSSLIWMPAETEYAPFFQGSSILGLLARPEYVLLSKALKAPKKNRPLIQEYLAAGASAVFLELAGKYQVNLEDFLS